jgi:hypothetical protein
MAHKRARASYTGFQVVVGPGEVRRVLEILRLDTVLAIYPRLDERWSPVIAHRPR